MRTHYVILIMLMAILEIFNIHNRITMKEFTDIAILTLDFRKERTVKKTVGMPIVSTCYNM